jgi:hypothetical protein
MQGSQKSNHLRTIYEGKMLSKISRLTSKMYQSIEKNY